MIASTFATLLALSSVVNAHGSSRYTRRGTTCNGQVMCGALLMNTALAYEICIISQEVTLAANALGFSRPVPVCDFNIATITATATATSTSTTITTSTTTTTSTSLTTPVVIPPPSGNTNLVNPASTVTSTTTTTLTETSSTSTTPVATVTPIVCLPGYQTVAGSCSSCSAGTSSPGGLAPVNACVPCSAGTFSAASASKCSNCTPGSSTSMAGSGSCSTCGIGYFSKGTGDLCTLCTGATFSSTAGSSSCSACPDTHAATCDNQGKTLTCANYYTVSGGICQAYQFARYTNSDAFMNDLTGFSAQTETQCILGCEALNPVNGPFTSITFVGAGAHSFCYCKTNSTMAAYSFLSAPGKYADLIGSCAFYASLPNPIVSATPCQDVKFSSSGCIGIDGKTPCACEDLNASACDPITGQSTVCTNNKAPVSGVCSKW